MKKLLLGNLTLVLLSFSSTISASASELHVGENNESAIETRAGTIQHWFKGIPPEKYKGKTRVRYYKAQGGYIGVYLDK